MGRVAARYARARQREIAWEITHLQRLAARQLDFSARISSFGPAATLSYHSKPLQGSVRMAMPSAGPLSESPYGDRARIGYTSPPLTTEVFPFEFYKMAPAGVTLVITTLAIVVRSKQEVDQSYEISMRAAREMAAAGVDIIVLGGVPINLSRGAANAEQMIRDLEAELKVKVSTSASAQARAAKALGCKKVVGAAPSTRSAAFRSMRRSSSGAS
jgi:hypothetical protein